MFRATLPTPVHGHTGCSPPAGDTPNPSMGRADRKGSATMHRAAVLIIGLVTLATGPASAGEDAEAFFAAGLGAASVPEEMGPSGGGQHREWCPPGLGKRLRRHRDGSR